MHQIVFRSLYHNKVLKGGTVNGCVSLRTGVVCRPGMLSACSQQAPTL